MEDDERLQKAILKFVSTKGTPAQRVQDQVANAGHVMNSLAFAASQGAPQGTSGLFLRWNINAIGATFTFQI